jgi:aminoglycoside phosphotransferase (APT) family kinase protein
MDYTLANVLVDGDTISGVIDWGGTRSGDRLFDLATLVYYARGEAQEIERYVVERIGREGLSVYLRTWRSARATGRLRHHGLAAGVETVDYSLAFARRFP